MSDHSITSLIEKLEGAESGSRELDALVHVVVANDPNTYVVEPAAESIFSHKPGWYRTGTDLSFLADPVTTSLDAALALAERVLTMGAWDVGYTYNSERPHYARLVIVRDDEGQPEIHGRSATPALALCAAILRAQWEARV